ncbi:MAG TPA: ChbG/HpnK family deacetylase, partial [Puia sp.]
MRSRLIVNADGLGISNTVNRAILESIESGLVTSTSIMANMPGFEDAVGLLRDHANGQIRVGVHLNLTTGYPLSREILDCPRFCNDNGRFIYDRKRRFFRLSRSERRAAYKEMQAQIEKVLAGGIIPAHLDSHHHFHTWWGVAPLVCRLGREYNVRRIRLTRNIGRPPTLAKRIYKKLFNKWRLGGRHEFRNTD